MLTVIAVLVGLVAGALAASVALWAVSGSRVRRDEERHIALYPAGEREEVRQLLARDGLSGDVLAQATDAVVADRERWIEVMMEREHGMAATRRDFEMEGATVVATPNDDGTWKLVATYPD